MKFRVVENFWENFLRSQAGAEGERPSSLDHFQKRPVRPQAKSHRIHKLSAQYRTTIYSAVIEADLRIIFRMDGETVTTLDIGTHAIYK